MNEPPPIVPNPPGPTARLHLRVLLGPATAMGPGKADFLAAVDAVGSIAGAGRALGLSYMKARHLLDALNSAFCGPVVVAHKEGRFGGACLTPLGREVLACYRAVERRATRATRADLDHLAALARTPGPAPPPADPAAPPSPEAAPDNDDAGKAAPARRRRAPGQRSSV